MLRAFLNVLRANVDLQTIEQPALCGELRPSMHRRPGPTKLDVSKICVLGFDRLGALSNV